MTRGLAEKHGLQLVAARGARTFPSILEISRRTHLPVSALVQLAKADAFRSLHLTRREASWAIKALRDNTLPLFDDADRREQRICPELTEPPVTLTPMTKGREVVEDYRSHGLSLRSHPLAFLRKQLTDMNIMACAGLRDAKNGQRVTVSGLVLVRQMPGSAKGVMFITLEDETDIANLIVWPSQFEKQRRWANASLPRQGSMRWRHHPRHCGAPDRSLRDAAGRRRPRRSVHGACRSRRRSQKR